MLVVKPITSSLGQGNTGISLENIALSGVGVAVADTSGATLLPASGSIDQWTVGPVYEGSAREFSQGKKVGQYRREHSLLDAKGNYFERARPQYEDQPASAFVHTKDLGCAGDGSTDDTAAFQAALYSSCSSMPVHTFSPPQSPFHQDPKSLERLGPSWPHRAPFSLTPGGCVTFPSSALSFQ